MARAKTPGLKKFNIYLPIPVMGALDHLAKLRNATRAELVRDALREYAKAELLKERDTPEFGELIGSTPIPEGTAKAPVELPPLRKPEVQMTMQLGDVDPNASEPNEFPTEKANAKPRPMPNGPIRIS